MAYILFIELYTYQNLAHSYIINIEIARLREYRDCKINNYKIKTTPKIISQN